MDSGTSIISHGLIFMAALGTTLNIDAAIIPIDNHELYMTQQKYSTPDYNPNDSIWNEFTKRRYEYPNEEYSNKEKELIILNFAKYLIENSVEMDPEFNRVIDDNFWELI